MTYARLRTLGITALAISSLALAQQTNTNGGGGTPAPTPPPTNNPGGGGGNPPGGGRGGTPQPSQPPQRTPEMVRPLYVSGVVVLSDGTEPPERVMIERVCSAGSVRPEGYTDSKGSFSFQLGVNQAAFADASTGFFGLNEPANLQGPGFPNQSATGTIFEGGRPETAYWNCELRGKLAGYRSESVPLAGKRYMDNPDVGRIILHPMAKTEGLTESATASLAPKDARKAYEKGVENARKNKPEQAEKELRKAVDLYPKHAPAWFELGKLADTANRFDDARTAYLASLEADSKFVYPLVNLYRLEFRRENWPEVAQRTEELIRLNPYEFPDAFYYQSVALLQMQQYKAAADSAREAVKADWKQSNPKTHYVLGIILANLGDLDGSEASLNTFLEMAPENDAAIGTAKDVLGRIEKARATAAQ